MELLETMMKRRSVRRYSDGEISDDNLNRILEAGLLAPSSRNLFPTEIIVVRDKEKIAQLARAKTSGSDFIKGASCAVAVIADSEKSDVWVEDASLVMIYMQLRAAELNIGNCWVQCRNRFSQNKSNGDSTDLSSECFVKNVLKIPQNYSVLAILALGIPAQMPEPHTPDKSKFDKIHRETF